MHIDDRRKLWLAKDNGRLGFPQRLEWRLWRPLPSLQATCESGKAAKACQGLPAATAYPTFAIAAGSSTLCKQHFEEEVEKWKNISLWLFISSLHCCCYSGWLLSFGLCNKSQYLMQTLKGRMQGSACTGPSTTLARRKTWTTRQHQNPRDKSICHSRFLGQNAQSGQLGQCINETKADM